MYRDSFQMEGLEARRLMSASVSDQVLGIADAASNQFASPAVVTAPVIDVPAFVFVGGPVVFTSTPNVVGSYSGGYTVKPADFIVFGETGLLTVTVTSQVGRNFSANMTINSDHYVGLTGWINLHGGFWMEGIATNKDQIQMAGHLTASLEFVTNGSFGTRINNEFPPHNTAIGHFSLTNAAARYHQIV